MRRRLGCAHPIGKKGCKKNSKLLSGLLKDAVIATMIATGQGAGPYKNIAWTTLTQPPKSQLLIKDRIDVVFRSVNFHQGGKLEIHAKFSFFLEGDGVAVGRVIYK